MVFRRGLKCRLSMDFCEEQVMRLSASQIVQIRQAVSDFAGSSAIVKLFGSRTDNDGLGGDVDLLVECPAPVDAPALVAARIGGRISRAMAGRKVDVLLSAPNLQQTSLHETARRQGVLL